MFIAEYIRDGKLIRVYVDNGRKVVTEDEYIKGKAQPVMNGYIPRKKEKSNG